MIYKFQKVSFLLKMTGLISFIFMQSSLFRSCHSNDFKVDLTGVNPRQKVVRFDSLLFEGEPDSVALNINEIVNKYPEFSELYFKRIIKVGSPETREFFDLFTLFLSDYDIRMAYQKSKELFENFMPYKKSIYKAFRHYQYYFPEKNVPDIYLMMSGFNQSLVMSENILAISLDKFLGENARYYDQLQISRYLRKRMKPEVVPYEAVKGWLVTEFPYNDSVKNLVSHMIYHGKILYMMDAFFPKAADSLKIGYSAREYNWCMNSEDEVWLYMMDKKILFDSDHMLIRRFIEAAPFTGPFGKHSPGRVGQWIGWQIVRSYMDAHPKVTIPELMQKENYQQILAESQYNP